MASYLVPTSELLASVVLLIGMAVGVDYSLFYVRRAREQRNSGDPVDRAIEVAAATSGRAVVISGLTTVVAMAGMFADAEVRQRIKYDPEQAKRIIKSTAQLRLTLVENGPFPSREAAHASYGNQVPSHLEVLPGNSSSEPADRSVFYVVEKTAAVSGTDLRDARASTDEFNRPAVAFTLTPEAGRRFGAFTERHINGTLATVLDNRVASIATINSRIEDQGQIVGVSREAMLQQVINLKTGALPADLEYVAEHRVGASLGEDSIRSGIAASAGGLALVGLFLLAYYRRSGTNALISIVVNLLILMGFIAFIPVTMTLPAASSSTSSVDSARWTLETSSACASRSSRMAVNNAGDTEYGACGARLSRTSGPGSPKSSMAARRTTSSRPSAAVSAR